MRWKILNRSDLERERVVRRFLWFPTKLNYEVRWLEYAFIKQKVTESYNYDGYFDGFVWEDYEFINN